MSVSSDFYSHKGRAGRLALFLFLSFSLLAQANAQPGAYTWKSVIDGGGGFVPGIIYSRSARGLVYARTDMGGAYRWSDSVDQWIPITDMMDRTNSDFMGILSIALDPTDTNRVYMETGKYTQGWAGKGALLSSIDKGHSWKIIGLPFKVGGNEDGRGCGERLQVDPNADSILFMGTSSNSQTNPSQAALWKSTDFGSSWSKVQSFSPTDVNFVLFDSTEGSRGSPTDRIFVATANTNGGSLYETTDGGITWSVVAGQPGGVMAIRGAIADTILYVTFSNNKGPNGATAGSVWKYNTSSGDWSNISPSSGSYGFSGISIYPGDPRILIVSTLDRWSPMDEIYLSTNGGSTWQGRLVNARLDHSYAPYTSTVNPHWVACVAMDPFDSSRAMFGTGFGVWACDNLFAPTPTWYFKDENLEEMVPMQVISPPFTNVMSAVGDYDGFRNDKLDVSPDRGRYSPAKGTTLSIAFAAAVPSMVIKAFNSRPYGAYSTDGGAHWRDFKRYPAGTTAGGTRTIAISADGRTIVWAPTGAPMSYSTDNGSTWATCGGDLPATVLPPVADRVNPDKFYAYLPYGQLWVSKDGGRTFNRTLAGLPSTSGQDGNVNSVPGREGDIWICCGSGGLCRSQNSGSSYSTLASVKSAYLLGFGRSAVAGGYPAIYLWGVVRDTLGIFRSIDTGATWSRINDDNHQFGYLHQVTGDPRVFGRCYISAEGRGVLYGEPPNCDTTANPSTFMFHPASSDSLAHFYQSLTVSWGRSIGHGDTPLAYVLHFFGPGVDTTFGTADSAATFSVGRISGASTYVLTGWSTNGWDTTASSNNLSFPSASTVTEVQNVSGALPKTFLVYQNFPNPFNPSTVVEYQLPIGGKVTMDVYDILGQRVIERNYGMQSAGVHKENLDMAAFSSGVYFCRIQAAGKNGMRFSSSRKILLVK